MLWVMYLGPTPGLALALFQSGPQAFSEPADELILYRNFQDPREREVRQGARADAGTQRPNLPPRIT